MNTNDPADMNVSMDALVALHLDVVRIPSCPLHEAAARLAALDTSSPFASIRLMRWDRADRREIEVGRMDLEKVRAGGEPRFALADVRVAPDALILHLRGTSDRPGVELGVVNITATIEGLSEWADDAR